MTQTDKGKQVYEGAKQAQKPKKGVPMLIPPKLVLFKKLAQQKFTGGPKQVKNKQPTTRATEIIKGPDGFFEVAVQYGICKDLAEGTGLKVQDVTNMLEVDNQESKFKYFEEMAARDMEVEEEGLDLDFESDEDLLSDED